MKHARRKSPKLADTYLSGASINSVCVKQILQSESLIPTYVCLAKLPLISYLPLPVECIL